MFINDPYNRGVVKEVADENDLDLIDPEIFLRFVDPDEFFIKTWDDVKREMFKKGFDNFSMTKLKQQYKWCGIHLYSRGYTDFDRSKI